MVNHAKAAFFDAQVDAPWAAMDYGEAERPKLERLLRESELGPGQRVLEPGCGTGRLTEVLAGVVGDGGLVLALDISPAMVKACARRVARWPQVRTLCTALEDLREPPDSFDRVICHQVFPHFDDQLAALRRMTGMLRPGGVLVVAHFINSHEINDTHRKAGTVVEGDLLPPPETMRRMVTEAGLVLEWQADDGLGYFLKARRLGDGCCLNDPSFGR
ncbi:MAG: class I SAM-dependent methyltransferase [Desulfarculus sp.]|nr:class I SAM-dependent methyltransferase [Desulfarculus sp.]